MLCVSCKKEWPEHYFTKSSKSCKACRRIIGKRSYEKNKEKNREARNTWSRKFYHRTKNERQRRAKEYRQKLRSELIAAYGGKCSCCEESEPAFLTLEHKNRDGKAHRMLLSNGKNNSWSSAVYLDLKRRGWPRDGYTLLCFNCNHATWKLGICPHATTFRL